MLVMAARTAVEAKATAVAAGRAGTMGAPVQGAGLRNALHARAQGTVTVEATVRTDGSVGDVHIIRSFNPPFGLDTEAVRTVQKWRFHPGTRRGRPVPMLVTIELTFGLR
jgi:TonB family protein